MCEGGGRGEVISMARYTCVDHFNTMRYLFCDSSSEARLALILPVFNQVSK